jgi:hypothetical protein
MRINIYNEEIVSDRVELREKTPENAQKVAFNGIQFFVFGAVEHTPGDDDSPAVVFWYSDEHTRALLRSAFAKALKILDDNPPK